MRRGAQVSVHLDGDFTPYNPLEIAIQQMTDEWFLEVQEELDADIEEAANRAMTQLRRTSPYHRGSGRGHYRSGWRTAVGKASDNDLTYGSWARVYNYNKPTLGHLLEYGHDIKRGGKVVGHAAAIPHVEHARQTAANYLKRKGWIR